jgi:hypothetical protein
MPEAIKGRWKSSGSSYELAAADGRCKVAVGLATDEWVVSSSIEASDGEIIVGFGKYVQKVKTLVNRLNDEF